MLSTHAELSAEERQIVDDVFEAQDLWRTPFVGLHRYALPDSVAEQRAPANDAG